MQRPTMTRRRFLTGTGGGLAATALTSVLPGWAPLRRLGLGVPPAHASPSVVLDPNDPLANFTQETFTGQGIFLTPTVLTVQDISAADVNNLYASEPHAAPGGDLDIFVQFKVSDFSLANADSGVWFVINDGESGAAVARCINNGGVLGIGIAAGINFVDPANYPVFVAVNWLPYTTLRLRRTAQGAAQIVELNGVAPNPPAVFPGPLPQRTRGIPSVEFGCASVEARATIDVQQFYSEVPHLEVPFAMFRARADLVLGRRANDDRFDVEALVTLGPESDGIDPLGEDATLELGPGAWTIPAGGFRAQRGGWFSFRGWVDGTQIAAVIAPLPGGQYTFAALGARAQLEGAHNPLPVGLTIGDDAGHTDVQARIVA